jgi:hypothetical protein
MKILYNSKIYRANPGRVTARLRRRRAATEVARAAIWVGSLIGMLGAVACSKKAPAPAASASAALSASAPPIVNAVPISSDAVRKAMNPDNLEPYTGPVGIVRGTVTVKGDVPPMLPEIADKIPDKCKNARLLYGRLFREGMMRSAADVLVTVSDYKGYLPARGEAVTVKAEDCAFQARTISMTFGQRLEVVSKDRESYLPQLIGGRMSASLYATPGGDPVKLYPQQPGRFTLADTIHPWINTDVFVMKYPTHTVTGLDGKFEITGVPVGEVTVAALMPATMQFAKSKVKVEDGKTVDVNLEVQFDAKKMTQEKPKKPAVEIH